MLLLLDYLQDTKLNFVMNHLICPLCCQQDFTSIVALREHLLYYIYRPITCPICNISAGGIHGLTRHLESHHIDNKQLTHSLGTISKQKEVVIDCWKSELNVINNKSKTSPQGRSFANSPGPCAVDLNHKEFAGHENHDSVGRAVTDLTSNYEALTLDNESNHVNARCNVMSLSSLTNTLQSNQNHLCSSESNESFDMTTSTINSLTSENCAANLEILKPLTLSKQYEGIMDDNYYRGTDLVPLNRSFEGFQALSEAVRAFVCITCGAKIVGKDLYFKHIQGKCSLESYCQPNVVNKESGCYDKNLNYPLMVDMSASHSLPDSEVLKNNSENSHLTLGENGKELNFSVDTEKSTFNSKKIIDMVSEKREETKPYIHKKFDHDQERKSSQVPASKSSQVPSSDVQCYIQNFQSLLVDKLNKTLENDTDKLPYIKNVESSSFFEVEKEIHFQSLSSDCEVKSTVGSLSPEKVEIQPIKTKVIARSSTNNKTIRCKFCPKTFKKPFLLFRHQQELHSTTTFFCSLCGHHFKSKRTLENHKGTHQEKKIRCSKCEYSCFTASGLRTHVFEIHSKRGKKEFCCRVCSESFKKKYGLDRHMKRKHGNDKKLCKYCDKQFLCKEDLNLHLAVHLNNKALTCSICKKLLTSFSSLKRHKSTHNGKRELFKCNTCSKVFTRKDSLQSHMKLHD